MLRLFLIALLGMFSLNAHQDLPMFSRKDLFSFSPCLAVKLSPRNDRLAFIGSDQNGVTNLFLSSDLTVETGVQVTQFDDPSIGGFFWTPDGKKILLLKDQNGKRSFDLWVYDFQSTKKIVDGGVKFFKMGKKKAVIGINSRTKLYYDLYHLDLDTYALTLIEKNDKYLYLHFDENLLPVIKQTVNGDGTLSLFHKEKPLFTLSSEDAFHTETVEVIGDSLYLNDNRGSNTTALKKINLLTGHTETIGHDERSDIQSVLFDGDELIAYSTYYTEKEWHPLKAKEEFKFLIDRLGSSVDITDQNGNLWIVKRDTPEYGVQFWLYNREGEKLYHLHTFPLLAPLQMTHDLVIYSRDGLPLVCYLTLPKEYKEGTPVPLVVVPHGGPFKARDMYAFNPTHQWLANRGYGALSVNFRLSSGFGKAFVNGGNGEWGGKAHEDIVDAIQWCIDKKITKKGRIAIYGRSYGGYEALSALTFTPDLFACSITVCGPSNLKTILEKMAPFWEIPSFYKNGDGALYTKQAFIVSMGGDPRKAEDLPFLESRSPLNFVNQIQNPLLLIHGENDPIVASSESDQIFHALEKKQALYLRFPDEGHSINKPANSFYSLAFIEWFLAKYLGGKCEPMHPFEREQTSAKLQAHNISIDKGYKKE